MSFSRQTSKDRKTWRSRIPDSHPRSKKPSVVGGDGIAIRREVRPGLRYTTAPGGWSNVSRIWKAFTCSGKALTCGHWLANGRVGKGKPKGGSSRQTWRLPRARAIQRPILSHRRPPLVADNRNVGQQRPRRWLWGVLGGLLFPLDPLLGLVLVVAGLWQPRPKASLPRHLRPLK